MGDVAQALRAQVWGRIDELSDRLWGVALRIHEHPELGFAEHQAAAWLGEALAAEGFGVERGVGGLATALRATHADAGEGLALAILAEYDALPVLGHACGHNIIATAALGAAWGLAPFKRELPGRLVVLGTPAEETGAGKALLIEAGLFRGLDAALMIHPATVTVLEPRTLAMSRVKVAFRGRAAHAAANPHLGVNALDAVIQTFNGLNAMRQQTRDGSRIHGIISDGGQQPNIIPEHAEAQFCVRFADNGYRDELLERLQRCAQGAALATGAELAFEKQGRDYQLLRSNHAMAQAFGRHIRALGYTPTTPEEIMGSTDIGNVSWQVPAIQPEIEIASGAALHSREFAEAARSARGRQGMLAAAKAIAATCLDLWLDPQLARAARSEFEQARRP